MWLSKNIFTISHNKYNLSLRKSAMKNFSGAYEAATLDTPAFHMALAPVLPLLRPLLRLLFHVRWQMSRPFQLPVLPKWVPYIPGLRTACSVTFGQVFLALPLFVLLFAGYTRSFLSPDLDSSGHVAAYAILFAFLTANKSNSFFSLVLGIPFERLIPYHNLASLIAICLSVFHTYVAFVYGDSSGDGGGSRDRYLSEDSPYGRYGPDPDLLKFLLDGGTNASGTAIILFMLGLVATSFFGVLRRYFFECWLFTHVACAIGVIIFCLAHSVGSILLVAFWWAVDIFFRYVVMSLCCYPKKASLSLLLPDVVEVRFPKSAFFNYNAGQYAQVSFPAIAPFQFHPITISSSPHEEDVTLHIRALGGWSKKLASLAAKSRPTTILLEGPYGSVAMDLENDDRYPIVLAVGGGIGVTPCQSIARSILHQHEHGRKVEKLHFVWAVQNVGMALVLPPPPMKRNLDVLSTDVYVTRPGPIDDEEFSALSLDTPFYLFEGRPNFDSIFADLKAEAQQRGVKRVAVIGCGPHGMINQLRAACRTYSDFELKCGGVQFDLHEEMFDF